jgi:hypothetical protein
MTAVELLEIEIKKQISQCKTQLWLSKSIK